ncbi:hypothetical protein [Nocardia sp. AG03]|uniref:hypothetical protein n=1 Tax=Nocardia sp. AG03 TaxID=3025312 RepID=UPI00241814E5|nr:hypothetical protein [Nocardia sp. AG03]
MSSGDGGNPSRTKFDWSQMDRIRTLPDMAMDRPARRFEDVAGVPSTVRHDSGDVDILAPGVFGQQSPQELVDLKYDYYKSLIQRNNGLFDDGPGKKNMVAIRHPTNTNKNGGKGEYDDSAFLLWIDEGGTKHVSQYQVNTDPSSQYLPGSDDPDDRTVIDVNGDGIRELGRLPVGSYTYYHQWFMNKHNSVGDGNVFKMREGALAPAQYDSDHDGRFDEGAWGPGGESMFWHRGRGDVASAGCQTMPPAEWERFIDDMDVSVLDKYDDDPVSLRYTLVDESPSKGNVPYGYREMGPISAIRDLAGTPGDDFPGSGGSMQSDVARIVASTARFLSEAVNNTFSAGGDVQGPGSSIGDKIPAYLSDGEFVMNARSTSVNRPFLQALNADPYFLQKMLEQRASSSGRDQAHRQGAPSGRSATVNISMSSQDDVVARLKVLAQQWELMNAN